ncbi:MAG: putative manganese transporter [Lachnospiraceae bacterium]|nr:putative manganese transporter [Lachnospiraceae bacterium]
MREILLDCIIDCLKLLPFLYLSYLVVEYAEHKMSRKTKEMIYRAGKAGPVLGSLIGIIPQCGFSAAAAGLFAGGMVSPGTLLAVFLSTSDEMLPIMVSEGIQPSVIVKILGVKVVVATVVGLAADFAAERILGRRNEMPEHPDMCEHEHCGCGEHGIWYSALNHTLQTAVFLFLISLAIGFGMEWFGVSGASRGISKLPGAEAVLSGLVGMIPNCAASVLITQLFLEGILSSGALFAGLLCGAGTGLLVLYRENPDKKMNLAITAALYVSGTLAGMIVGQLGIL